MKRNDEDRADGVDQSKMKNLPSRMESREEERDRKYISMG
jgi:hypothetical protein